MPVTGFRWENLMETQSAALWELLTRTVGPMAQLRVLLTVDLTEQESYLVELMVTKKAAPKAQCWELRKARHLVQLMVRLRD